MRELAGWLDEVVDGYGDSVPGVMVSGVWGRVRLGLW